MCVLMYMIYNTQNIKNSKLTLKRDVFDTFECIFSMATCIFKGFIFYLFTNSTAKIDSQLAIMARAKDEKRK